MFSRSDDGSRLPSRMRSGWWGSITIRLALGYLASSLLLIVVICWYLYDGLRSGLSEEDHALVADKIRILRAIVAESGNDPAAFRDELQLEHHARRFNPYYGRVLDVQGTILRQTPGMDRVLPPAAFPRAVEAGVEPGRAREWRAPDGRRFLLLAAWTRPPTSGETMLQLQAGLDVTSEADLLAAYRRSLWAAIIVGSLAALLLSVLVAKQGLRPVDVMTRAVRTITPTGLHRRIGEMGWPQELAGLATAFDEMLGRMEDAFGRLNDFSGDIAHELRTPIQNILGQTEVALVQATSPRECRRVLESNLEEMRRIAGTVDTLLFLSRAENAVTALNRTEIELGELLAEMRELYAPIAEEKGISVTCHGSARVHADRELMQRVLSNLLSNALRWTPPGGRVRLAVSIRTPPGSVLLEVADTGIGIPPECQERIFDRFYQVPDRDDAEEPGTGLGLTLVRSIVKLHGGTVQVESRNGAGSRFLVELPLSTT